MSQCTFHLYERAIGIGTGGSHHYQCLTGCGHLAPVMHDLVGAPVLFVPRLCWGHLRLRIVRQMAGAKDPGLFPGWRAQSWSQVLDQSPEQEVIRHFLIKLSHVSRSRAVTQELSLLLRAHEIACGSPPRGLVFR